MDAERVADVGVDLGDGVGDGAALLVGRVGPLDPAITAAIAAISARLKV